MKEDTSTNLRQVIPWTLFTGKMILPLFLIIVFCSMTNNLHAQDTRLNLKLENTTLLDAIKQISTTTGMDILRGDQPMARAMDKAPKDTWESPSPMKEKRFSTSVTPSSDEQSAISTPTISA